MTLTEQLNRMAEWPEVCRFENGVFAIGDYHFWHSEHYGFCAGEKIKPYNHITGRPALAWLRDALEQVIEARGWWYSCGWVGDQYTWTINTEENKRDRFFGNAVYGCSKDSAEALLAALIAALGEGKG